MSVSCAMCGKEMDDSDRIVHQHESLPIHGHCLDCIRMEKSRSGLQDEKNPSMHYQLFLGGIDSDMELDRISEQPGFEMEIDSAKHKIVIHSRVNKIGLPFCHLCEKGIASDEYVMAVSQDAIKQAA